MCVAMPALVLDVRDDGATVRSGNADRTVSTLLVPDVRPGDHVIISAGSIVERITAEEAAEREQLFNLLIEALDDEPPATAEPPREGSIR